MKPEHIREIKFRAWDGKYMVDCSFGNWVSFDGVPYEEANRKYDTPNIEIEKSKGLILMQFTGLHDKNGTPIYEGDILRDCLTKAEMEVVFGHNKNNAYNGWYCKYLNVQVRDVAINGDYDTDTNSQIEIIGNIYETKLPTT